MPRKRKARTSGRRANRRRASRLRRVRAWRGAAQTTGGDAPEPRPEGRSAGAQMQVAGGGWSTVSCARMESSLPITPPRSRCAAGGRRRLWPQGTLGGRGASTVGLARPPGRLLRRVGALADAGGMTSPRRPRCRHGTTFHRLDDRAGRLGAGGRERRVAGLTPARDEEAGGFHCEDGHRAPDPRAPRRRGTARGSRARRRAAARTASCSARAVSSALPMPHPPSAPARRLIVPRDPPTGRGCPAPPPSRRVDTAVVDAAGARPAIVDRAAATLVQQRAAAARIVREHQVAGGSARGRKGELARQDGERLPLVGIDVDEVRGGAAGAAVAGKVRRCPRRPGERRPHRRDATRP